RGGGIARGRQRHRSAPPSRRVWHDGAPNGVRIRKWSRGGIINDLNGRRGGGCELDAGDHHTFSPAKPDEIDQRLVGSELVDAVLSTTVMGTLLRVRDHGAVSRFMSSPDRSAQRELSPL